MCLLSLCMIVKNEQDVLERCLGSCFELFDEIIIVDTGSTDDTLKIAKKYTTQIYNFEWCDDFSKARNFAFSKAVGKYVMWLDADDVISRKNLQQLLALKQNLTADVYMLKYDIGFVNGEPMLSYFRERIIKNCKHAVWRGVVHECIVPFGKIERLDIHIEHKKIKNGDFARNYKIYKKLTKMRALTPREQYYFGRELYDNKKYSQSYSVLSKFVLSGAGWSENVIDALYLLAIIALIKNKVNIAQKWLYTTFDYDEPRANVCCQIGDIFLGQKKYRQAIWWYLRAVECEDVTAKGGFCQLQYYNYYPYLQLCVCYFNLGELKLAQKYNNMAAEFFESEQTLNNKKYFDSLSL